MDTKSCFSEQLAQTTGGSFLAHNSKPTFTFTSLTKKIFSVRAMLPIRLLLSLHSFLACSHIHTCMHTHSIPPSFNPQPSHCQSLEKPLNQNCSSLCPHLAYGLVHGQWFPLCQLSLDKGACNCFLI